MAAPTGWTGLPQSPPRVEPLTTFNAAARSWRVLMQHGTTSATMLRAVLSRACLMLGGLTHRPSCPAKLLCPDPHSGWSACASRSLCGLGCAASVKPMLDLSDLTTCFSLAALDGFADAYDSLGNSASSIRAIAFVPSTERDPS